MQDAAPPSRIGTHAIAFKEVVEAVDCSVGAVVEEAAVSGQRERNAVMPCPFRHLPEISACRAAHDATPPNVVDLVVGLELPLTTPTRLEKSATIVAGSHQLVIWGGRSVVLVATAVALVGAWRSWQMRGLRVTAILQMALPAMLVLMTGFGGEVLFRVSVRCTVHRVPGGGGLPAARRLRLPAAQPARDCAADRGAAAGFMLSYYARSGRTTSPPPRSPP
jgi:hypothetical protein